MKDICSELVNVRRIRLSTAIPLLEYEDMCRILLLLVTLPTVRELCIDPYRELKKDIVVVKNIFNQNNIQYSDGYSSQDEKIYIFKLETNREQLRN